MQYMYVCIVYDVFCCCLECHGGGRFEDKMYYPGPDRNRKNNCVSIQLIL